MSQHGKIRYLLSKFFKICAKSRRNGCKCAESRLHSFSHSGIWMSDTSRSKWVVKPDYWLAATASLSNSFVRAYYYFLLYLSTFYHSMNFSVSDRSEPLLYYIRLHDNTKPGEYIYCVEQKYAVMTAVHIVVYTLQLH